VQAPTKCELVINLKAAKALGACGLRQAARAGGDQRKGSTYGLRM
jgi:hypothetical protein